MISRRTGSVLAAVCVTGGAVALAQPAQAYDTAAMKVSCSAVNVRSGPSQGNVIVGVGYRGDSVKVTQFVYKVSERRWYSHGTVTRRSDGRKVSGYGIYDCINPYNASPPPGYPKRP